MNSSFTTSNKTKRLLRSTRLAAPVGRSGRARWAAVTLLALGLCPLGSMAQSQDAASALRTRALAATCANCHGTDGAAVPSEVMVALKGLPKAHLSMQLKAFKDGSRFATVMHQIARGYSDEQIEQLAAYFSSLK